MTTTPPPAGQARPEPDWPTEVAARIESAVTTVRDKTTVPATLAARGIVYGLVLGVLGAALFILTVIAVVRICVVYLPFHPIGRRVWVTYAGGSAIFLLAGAFTWRKRRPKRP